MNYLKEQRQVLGFTQKDLAQKTGLSLRTIQRVEAGKMLPKGHTLQQLAGLLAISPQELQRNLAKDPLKEEKTQQGLVMINLAMLFFFIFPFGNIFFPFFFWKRKSRQYPVLKEPGRRIVNFQIIWSLSLALLLAMAPFINLMLKSNFPFILLFLFLAIMFNILVLIKVNHAIRQHNYDFLKLRINLI